MRVLLLLDQLHDFVAGAERMAAGLALNLPQERFEVTVCTTRTGKGRVIERLEDHGVRHLHLGRRWRGDLHRFGPLLAHLRGRRVDILHSHMFGSNVWGTLFGRAAGVPVVIAQEHTWSYQGQLVRRLADGYLIGRLADAFVAVSRADRERMIAIEHVPAHKVHVIPNAWLPRPPRGEGDLRRELGLAPDVPLVGSVAVLRPQKALEVLVEAFAIVRRTVPDVHLVIAGKGECREQLERHVAQRDLSQSVHFLGHREDVDVVWNALDVAAISSDWEGMPLSALEAMANGRALAVTAVGGLLDMLEDGVSALMVAPRDPPALAEAITTLLRDPARRAKLAAAARERSRQFTIERLTDRYADLYLSLLKQKRALSEA